MIDKILENNRRFVARKGYVKHITDGKSAKHFFFSFNNRN